MNLHRLDLNLLVVLDTLLKYRSVTRAAEVLHVSQPTVSHALARLRTMLEDPLLVRTQGRMEPTAKAQRLQLPLQQVLHSLQDLLAEEAELVPEKLDETFYIGATDYADFVLLSEVIERVQREAPRLKVVTRSIMGTDLNNELASGELDCAIVFLVAPVPGIYEEALLKDAYVCLGKSLPEAGLSIEHYVRAQHVQVSHRGALEAVPDEVLRRFGMNRDVMVSTPHFMAAASVAARTGLLMTTAERVATHLSKEFPLRVSPLPFDMPPIELTLAWHSRTHADAAHQWFRNIIRQVAADLMQRESGVAPARG